MNMSEFTIIDRVLNIYHTVHSAAQGHSTVKDSSQRPKMKDFGKIIILFSLS